MNLKKKVSLNLDMRVQKISPGSAETAQDFIHRSRNFYISRKQHQEIFLTLRWFFKTYRCLTRRLSFLLVLIIGLGAAPVTAQITPNGLGTQVSRDANTFHIQGGTQAGRNLFHSFAQFGLHQGQIANF